MNNILPPIGIINTIKEWIDKKDRSNSNGLDIKEIYPATPISIIKRRPPFPPSNYSSDLDGGNVAVIQNGRVWGSNGAIITPDNNLIWDVSFEGFNITPDTHSIFKEKSLPAVSYFKNVGDLTHIFGMNYYHWMYEVLPRIHLIQQSGLKVDQFIVKFDTRNSFQTETLHQLGIKEEQLLITHSGFHAQAENLIIPSQPWFPTKWGFDFLRNTFLRDTILKSSDKKRIYITRKGKRKITNEDQVMEVLTKYGFVKVELESLSVAEQVQLFSSAEVIIAVHGAGLTNLTFCQPGTTVLEIFPRSYIRHYYWTISTLAKLSYYYFIGKVGDRDSQNLNRWAGNDDVTIMIPKFRGFLKKFLNL